jgi:hypothetical protein
MATDGEDSQEQLLLRLWPVHLQHSISSGKAIWIGSLSRVETVELIADFHVLHEREVDRAAWRLFVDFIAHNNEGVNVRRVRRDNHRTQDESLPGDTLLIRLKNDRTE